MKSPQISFLFLPFILCANFLLLGQTAQNSPENISERAQFLMYVDTIDKYLYRDAKLVDELIEACELIKQNSKDLTNDDIFKYVIEKIYYEQNKNNFLACYQLVKENEHLLADESVLAKTKNSFIYIRAHTYMTLGDVELAQKSFYEILEKGRTQKDSLLIFQGLYALGTLYSDTNDHPSAIKSFLELVELRKIYKIRSSNHSLIDYELGKSYMKSGQFEEAEKMIEVGLQFLEEQKLHRLKPDFLILNGEIALEQEQKGNAEKIYQNIKPLIQESNDPITLQSSQIFHAKLLTQQGKYKEALVIYENLLAQGDTTNLSFTRSIYEKAHVILFKMGNIDKAYQYLLIQQDIVEKIKKKEKQQETAYLKIKFESNQKEKENQQLALEVLKEQNRNRYLYFMTTFFLMSLLILFWAFHQKRKFSQTLQTEVKERTKELEQSNRELEKFTYMASHDFRDCSIKCVKTKLSNFNSVDSQRIVRF